MTKSFLTVNGQIIGETTNGVFTGYLPDAQGNVVATVDESGALLNTYRYKPSGELLDKTGTGADPAFLWAGTLGYRFIGLIGASHYVRARHFAMGTGQWHSVDALWPSELPYVYCGGNPVSCLDPSGDLALKASDMGGRVKWAYSCHGKYQSVVEITGYPRQVGYVIQRVTITDTVSTCEKDGKPKTETFFEAWCVILAGGSYRLATGNCTNQVDAQYDIWAANLGSDKGSIVGKGEMVFMAGKPKDFDKYFKVGNVARAGRLLSAKTYPHFPKKIEATQTVNYTWSCCCPKGATKRVCTKSFTRVPTMAAIFDDDCKGNCPSEESCS